MKTELFEPPTINPWRQPPTTAQIRYATDLCRSELPHPQDTIDDLPLMSRSEMTRLIGSLRAARLKRLKAAPRTARWRLLL